MSQDHQCEVCRIFECRSSRGYAATGASSEIVLRAPPSDGALPDIRSFATEQALTFPHFRKHSRSAPTGADVLELVRLAWPARVHSVVETSGREGLMWLLESESFRCFFETSRLNVATKRCSRNYRCCAASCDRNRSRPEFSTIRSIHRWSPLNPEATIRHSVIAHDRLRAEYLVGFDDSFIGARYPIVRDIAMKPIVESCAVFAVPIVVNRDLVTVAVRADRGHMNLIRGQTEVFAQTHEIIFTRFDECGRICATFIERD